jgi:hypothetical protein
MTHLLLSGRPGAGKTHIGKWLKELHGFRHLETDAEPQTLNDLLNGVQSPQSLGDNVVVEWGFAIGDFDKGLVHKLFGMGFDAWWLDGDERTCHRQYLAAKQHLAPADLERAEIAYRIQASAIQEAWPRLHPFYGDDRIICTVTVGPTGPENLTREQIVSLMLADDDEG